MMVYSFLPFLRKLLAKIQAWKTLPFSGVFYLSEGDKETDNALYLPCFSSSVNLLNTLIVLHY
jgi:hypothetical protein